ncbi:MAG: tRNA pseudouridine(55) synthase TruB [Blautia sp.]
MINGVINVYKERGYTSHDVVARLRGILKQKKIGHTGTLDPEAAGVLPVCLGRATKLCELLTDKKKTYEAVLHLGIVTDTQDMTGKILEQHPVTVSEEAVRDVIVSFLGEREQIPPMYSALKVNGRKLYELAREGKTVERKPRTVTFYEIEIQDISLPMVRFSVTCSKGTYIRTLCHDIGAGLGCGGCMESLLRTRVERFTAEESLTLEQIEKAVKENTLMDCIVSIEEMFSSCEKISMPEEMDILLHNGNAVPSDVVPVKDMENHTRVRMYDSQNRFIGIYEYEKRRQRFRLHTMFCVPEDFREHKKEAP